MFESGPVRAIAIELVLHPIPPCLTPSAFGCSPNAPAHLPANG